MLHAPCERGSATFGAVVWIAVVVGLIVGLGQLHGTHVDRVRAQTAADAAALAGAAATDAVAREAATRNDAVVLSIERAGTGALVEVQVTVIVGDRRATGRARRFVEG